MSNGLIAFLCSLGATSWVFNKFYKTTGGNTKTSFGAAAITGTLVFLIVLTVLWQIN